jgi:hypothetical protein
LVVFKGSRGFHRIVHDLTCILHHLSKIPVWPSKGRSEGNALTLDFLAQYSAAVYVDLFPSLLLEEHTKDKNKTVTRTVPKVGPMIVRRPSVQNMVMGIQ